MSLFLIISIALLVRIYHHHHILMSDEANNMLTIKAFIEGDGLREYFFKHPPLFTVLSSVISYPFGDNLHIVQGLSILFSAAAFYPFYLITEKVFDRRTALLSLAILAVLPVNILYSTWVKQEAMLLFFFLWTLYFYVNERPLLSGVLFGVTLLVKEQACFLVPIAIGWEAINGWEGRKAFRRLLVWLLSAFAVSGWWYLIFGGLSFATIINVITLGNPFDFPWHYPWYYYLRNLRADLTLILIPFFVMGLFSRRWGKGYLPHLWFLSLYLPLSLFAVKAPWYIYLASPAIAVIIALGLIEAVKLFRSSYLRYALIAMVSGYLLLSTCNFNSDVYYHWLILKKVPLYNDTELLTTGRDLLKGAKKVAILEYKPTLQYYLGIPDRRRVYLGSQFPAMDSGRLRDLAEKKDVGWFVIDTDSTNYIDKNISDLTYLYGEPKRVGNVLVFKVAKGNIP